MFPNRVYQLAVEIETVIKSQRLYFALGKKLKGDDQ